MAEDQETEKKSIAEHVEEFWQGILDTLEGLVTPAPQLIPVRVHTPPRRQRRR